MKLPFPNRHAILPVIHVEAEDQALRNAEIAQAAGSDGVFLINHSMSETDLLTIAARVRRVNPDLWIGVNCLGVHPGDVFALLSDGINGLWVDNAMVEEDRAAQPEAEEIQAARSKSGWKGLYFGGVAFKYQRHVEDLETAARLAAKYMDVVTTSGPRTGGAAEVEKIARMKAAIGSYPLALASGITPENVHAYLPHADCFLVATGISRSFSELEPSRVRSLVAKVRDFRRD